MLPFGGTHHHHHRHTTKVQELDRASNVTINNEGGNHTLALFDQNDKARQQWLDAHNDRRKRYQEGYGVSYRTLKWSNGLEELAQEGADENAEQCKNRDPGAVKYGVNSQMMKGSGSSTPTSAEKTLTIWENRLSKGYPGNQAITQVLWKSTEYVGCASASGDGCAFSVCFYAKPGNCGMGKSKGPNWKVKTYADSNRCIPRCPSEGC